jgi:cell division protein FtsX
MLERLSNVIYYFLIFIGILVSIIGIYMNREDYIKTGLVEYIYYGLFIILSGFFIFVIGWSIRYIITGNKSLL